MKEIPRIRSRDQEISAIHTQFVYKTAHSEGFLPCQYGLESLKSLSQQCLF
jgi:hypothetical protein